MRESEAWAICRELVLGRVPFDGESRHLRADQFATVRDSVLVSLKAYLGQESATAYITGAGHPAWRERIKRWMINRHREAFLLHLPRRLRV